ncbi:MAG TPA: LysR family transcriptional regulator [Polyangiales bacterium]|nr:LysR family transcriptional regulator [Polyangiales bacterium]
MELDHLEAFVAIVRRGGVTRAASALHLSQPAISRRLHLLEHELGAPLFERIGRTFVLTEAGRTFLPHAQTVLAAMRDAMDAVGALSDPTRGTVTLALVGTLASSHLTPRLQRFRRTHPRIDLRLRTALSAEVSELVRSGDASLGLRYRADRASDLISRQVFEERMLVVCSPELRLARGTSVSVKALANQRWIAFPPRPGRAPEPYASTLEQRLLASGLDGAEIVPIDSLSAQKRLVEAGFGLALMPESSVVEELRAKTLRVLRVPSMQASVPVVLVQRRHAYASAATKALAALLCA